MNRKQRSDLYTAYLKLRRASQNFLKVYAQNPSIFVLVGAERLKAVITAHFTNEKNVLKYIRNMEIPESEYFIYPNQIHFLLAELNADSSKLLLGYKGHFYDKPPLGKHFKKEYSAVTRLLESVEENSKDIQNYLFAATLREEEFDPPPPQSEGALRVVTKNAKIVVDPSSVDEAATKSLKKLSNTAIKFGKILILSNSGGEDSVNVETLGQLLKQPTDINLDTANELLSRIEKSTDRICQPFTSPKLTEGFHKFTRECRAALEEIKSSRVLPEPIKVEESSETRSVVDDCLNIIKHHAEVVDDRTRYFLNARDRMEKLSESTMPFSIIVSSIKNIFIECCRFIRDNSQRSLRALRSPKMREYYKFLCALARNALKLFRAEHFSYMAFIDIFLISICGSLPGAVKMRKDVNVARKPKQV